MHPDVEALSGKWSPVCSQHGKGGSCPRLWETSQHQLRVLTRCALSAPERAMCTLVVTPLRYRMFRCKSRVRCSEETVAELALDACRGGTTIPQAAVIIK